jgi:hypothetical protein
MNVNWDTVVKLVVPVGALVLGKYLDRWFTKRSKLIVWIGNSSAFTVRGQKGAADRRRPIDINTHATVIRNTGREAAYEVRIGHFVLPDNYQLAPAVPHTVERMPNGISEIIIPQLVPDEQITVSYLYLPPILWTQINAYVKSKDGFAKVINVLPTPSLPKWMMILMWFLVFVGTVSVLYPIVGLIAWLFL